VAAAWIILEFFHILVCGAQQGRPGSSHGQCDEGIVADVMVPKRDVQSGLPE
jgi:hypothetical protein